MKLSKLLVLVPAFAMIACAGKKSSEEPKGPSYEVTQDVFDEQVNKCGFLKPGYNKAMKAEAITDGETMTMTLEQDEDIYHGTIEGQESYIDVLEYDEEHDTYSVDVYSRVGEDWHRHQEPEVTTAQLAELCMLWLPYQYKFGEFTYVEELKAYTAESFTVMVGEQEYTVEDAKMAFEDNIFQSFKATVKMGVNVALVEYKTTDVGKVDLSLPDVI